MDDNIFGKRLRQLRRERDIKMEDLATVLDTTQSTLSKYENGIRKPNIEMLDRIADYFGVTSDYLLGKDNLRTIKSFKVVQGVKDEVAKYGYDITGKSIEEIAKLVVKALKHDEINKL